MPPVEFGKIRPDKPTRPTSYKPRRPLTAQHPPDQQTPSPPRPGRLGERSRSRSPPRTQPRIDHVSRHLRNGPTPPFDAGADAFVTAGTHNLGPIEVLPRKARLLRHGELLWSDLQEPLSAIFTTTRRSAVC